MNIITVVPLHFTLVCASSLTVKSFHTKDISVRARLFAWAAAWVLCMHEMDELIIGQA